MVLIESSPKQVKIPPFPTLSILAIIVIPLLASLSWPFWSWYVDRQINAPSSDVNYAPDPGQFSGFTIVGAVVMTGAFAALVGLLIAWFAGRRKERWRGLRIFAWVVNGIGTAIGLALLVNYALKSFGQS
jgi:hypothetical protein